MAKKQKGLVKLVNKETGHFIVRRKNPKSNKLSFKRYDPVAGKHVLFEETKLK